MTYPRNAFSQQAFIGRLGRACAAVKPVLAGHEDPTFPGGGSAM